MNNKIKYLVKKYQEGGEQTNDEDVALPDNRKWTDDEIWDLWTSNDFYKNLASGGNMWNSRAMSNQLNRAWNDKTKFLELYNEAMKHWYNLIYVNRSLRSPSNEELNADAFLTARVPQDQIYWIRLSFISLQLV